MKNKIIKILLLIVMMVGGLFILTGCAETTPTTIETTTTTNKTIEHKECKHDWVVTSKYSFWTDTYKTISKCSKCGKIVE